MDLTDKIPDRDLPFSKLLGIEFVSATQDKIVATLVVRPDLCTAFDTVHGGCLMAFADYCLFAISNKLLVDGRGVTLSFTSEFIDAAYEGELIEGHGEVVRAGRSILFLRGTLTSAVRPVLTFSGTIKRINGPRKPD